MEARASSTEEAEAPAWSLALYLGLAAVLLAVEYVPGVIVLDDPSLGLEVIEGARGPEGAIRQLGLLALGGWGVASLLRRAGRPLRLWTIPAALALAYLAVVLASPAWADEPGLVARRSMGFALMVVAAVAAARRLPVAEVARFALVASGVLVLLALGHEAWRGTLMSRAESYRFAGFFHPNALGGMCAVLALSAGSLVGRRRLALVLGGVALVGVWLLSLTRSRTALAGVVAGLVAGWVGRARPSRLVLALAVAGWVACLVLLVEGEAILTRIGDALLMDRADSEAGTLTGRTDLWRALLPYLLERPLLGYGLGGFWTAAHAQELFRSQGWAPAHAHSTYLAHALSLGATGLVVFLALLAAGLVRAARLARVSGETFPLSLLVFVAVIGLAETVEPYPSFLTFHFYWVIALLVLLDPEAAPTEAP